MWRCRRCWGPCRLERGAQGFDHLADGERRQGKMTNCESAARRVQASHELTGAKHGRLSGQLLDDADDGPEAITDQPARAEEKQRPGLCRDERASCFYEFPENAEGEESADPDLFVQRDQRRSGAEHVVRKDEQDGGRDRKHDGAWRRRRQQLSAEVVQQRDRRTAGRRKWES